MGEFLPLAIVTANAYNPIIVESAKSGWQRYTVVSPAGPGSTPRPVTLQLRRDSEPPHRSRDRGCPFLRIYPWWHVLRSPHLPTA